MPLTVWQGKLTYSSNPFGAAASTESRVDFNVVFRADLHDYRTEPGGQLKKQGAKAFRAAATSTVHWEVYNGPLPGATWLKYKEDQPYGLHGSAFPQYGKGGTGYILEGAIDRSKGDVAIAVDFLSTVATMHYNTPGVPDVDVATPHDLQIIAAILPDSSDGEAHFTPKVHGAIDDSLIIAAGTATGMTTTANNTKFVWPVLTPTHAPDKSLGEDQK